MRRRWSCFMCGQASVSAESGSETGAGDGVDRWQSCGRFLNIATFEEVTTAGRQGPFPIVTAIGLSADRAGASDVNNGRPGQPVGTDSREWSGLCLSRYRGTAFGIPGR